MVDKKLDDDYPQPTWQPYKAKTEEENLESVLSFIDSMSNKKNKEKDSLAFTLYVGIVFLGIAVVAWYFNLTQDWSLLYALIYTLPIFIWTMKHLPKNSNKPAFGDQVRMGLEAMGKLPESTEK